MAATQVTGRARQRPGLAHKERRSSNIFLPSCLPGEPTQTIPLQTNTDVEHMLVIPLEVLEFFVGREHGSCLGVLAILRFDPDHNTKGTRLGASRYSLA